jgi:diguanylate cyclase (GGDEF)-like protein/PAS domain S-box-containing protein
VNPSDGPVEGLEASLEDLYENAPCGYLSTAVDGTIVRVNDTFLLWTGYRRGDVVGVPLVSLLHTGSQLLYETRYLPTLLLNGESLEVALELMRADGTWMPILVNGALVRDERGAPLAVRFAVFDSSVRQGYERQLLAARRLAESSESHVRSLQDASSRFGVATTDGALADAIAKTAREAFAASGASVHLVDGEGALRRASADGAAGSPPPFDPALAELAMRRARPVVVARPVAEVNGRRVLADAMRVARAETLVVVPLRDDDRALGVVVGSFGRVRTFGSADIDLQQALARQAEQALTRIRLQDQLEHLALYDQLTGLARSKVVRDRLVDAIEYANLTSSSMAVIFIDLDGFKAVNDELGHVVGDTVLSQVGERLQSVVRHGDVVGRFGGDEFVVICEKTDAAAIERVSERLHAAIRTPFSGQANGAALTGSIGVAIHAGRDGADVSPDAMFESADEAMYRSKRAGKNRTTIVAIEAENGGRRSRS